MRKMEKVSLSAIEKLLRKQNLLKPIYLPLAQPEEKVEKTERIFLASPHMSEEGFEQAYVKEAFDTNWVAPIGKNLDMFESRLAQMVGSKYAVALTSGTAGLHLAVKNLGIKEGDVVFVQSLTFVATVNAVLYEKGVPVLIDSERDTWNMDPEALEKAFQLYKPKAVIVVHLYGNSAKMDEIKALCDKYDTPLIEDAAESLGTTYKGKWTGTFGDYGVFSFNGNKIITTSGGGMLVSDNETGIRNAFHLATQSKDPARYFQHSLVGYNYRMSNIVAGIGLGQLKVLLSRVKAKQEIYRTYAEAFAGMDEISMMPTHEGANNWLSCILIDSETVTPMMIMNALEEVNIESRLLWKPMHLQPLCEEFDFIGTGVADDLFARGLCLPSDTKMTQADLARVIEVIKSLW